MKDRKKENERDSDILREMRERERKEEWEMEREREEKKDNGLTTFVLFDVWKIRN